MTALVEIMKPIWHYAESIAFLAWLDFCLENKVNFTATIRQTLEETTGTKYKDRQISSRFYSLSRDNDRRLTTHRLETGEWNTSSPIIIRNNGSKALFGLPDEDQKAIKETAFEFGVIYPQYLQNSPSSGNTSNTSKVDRRAALLALRSKLRATSTLSNASADKKKRKDCHSQRSIFPEASPVPHLV